MSLQWNLWVWEGRSWRVLSTHESAADAEAVMHNCGDKLDTMTIARNWSPKDEYMRDNCTVRHAPRNYVRSGNPPYMPDCPEELWGDSPNDALDA